MKAGPRAELFTLNDGLKLNPSTPVVIGVTPTLAAVGVFVPPGAQLKLENVSVPVAQLKPLTKYVVNGPVGQVVVSA
jgi:hypothetical protein